MAVSAWGSSEELWASAASEALREGHAVTLSLYDWSPPAPRVEKLQVAGAQLVLRSRRRYLKIERAVEKLWGERYSRHLPMATSSFRKVFEAKPDVICINEGTTYSFLGLPDLTKWLMRLRLPYVVVCHGALDAYLPNETERRKAIEFYANADCVVFVSERSLKSVERQLAHKFGNAGVIQNPMLFDARIEPPAYVENDEAQLAMIARMDALVKGHDVLLESLAQNIWRNRAWHLNIYGDGEDENYIRRLAAHYDLSSRLTFHGYAEDVRAVWAANQLMLLPSRTEGAPTSLIEAMLCARPAVATDVGGVREWLKDDETGFIAEAATAASFSRALERAWRKRAMWGVMGECGRASALAKLDLSPEKTLLEIVVSAAAQRQTVSSG